LNFLPADLHSALRRAAHDRTGMDVTVTGTNVTVTGTDVTG
jgi:hypothetical protein